MNIIIQKINNVYVIRFKRFAVASVSIIGATKLAGVIADSYMEVYGKRPTITVLPIQTNPMATKKTYPAKKKAVVKKGKKKVVKKKK